MKTSNLLISGAVAALCAGILVLFTDIEMTVVRWVNCGPFASEAARRDSRLCR